MSEHSDRKGLDPAKPPPPTRAQRLAAAGFLGAFGLTILTILLTGLKVGAPATRHLLQPATVAPASSAPDARAETRSASSRAVPSAPNAPTVNEAQTSANAGRADAGRDREDAVRDRDDARRKASREHAGDPPANEAR